MSVDPSGHTTHVALEHCESRPSPMPPVFDIWFANRTVMGVGGTQPPQLLELLTGHAIDGGRR